MDQLEIKGSVKLPLVGAKTLVLDEPISGLEDAALTQLLALDGSSLDVKASVSESKDGIEIAAIAKLPLLGEQGFSLDEKLTGLERTAIDELLQFDGGTLPIDLAVTRKGT